MKTTDELYERMVDVCTEPDARSMARILDRALNAMVEKQEHAPIDSFQDDYYFLEMLRTAVRKFADGPEETVPIPVKDLSGKATEAVFKIDTTGQTPLWSFPQNTFNDKGEEITITASFSPHPLVEIVQNASVRGITEQFNTAIDLLKKADDSTLAYQDAIDMIKWVRDGFLKGKIACE